jgi:hypothetical protein
MNPSCRLRVGNIIKTTHGKKYRRNLTKRSSYKEPYEKVFLKSNFEIEKIDYRT